MARFTLQWTIKSEGAGKDVKSFLKEKKVSKTALTDIKFRGGSIAVNGKEVTVRYLLQHNDRLEIQFPIEQPSVGLKPERIPLEIIYEDDYLLIVNKPIEMNTIPSREHPTGSLANGLIHHFNERGLQATVHIVTRLDRNTSGLVLVAKYRHVHHLLSIGQKDRQIKRIYEAFVEGNVNEISGSIEEPIGRKEDSIIEREVRPDGQYAMTHYKVLGKFPQFTWLQLRLETGRTHQIRVHLSYVGHSLVGDDLYGGKLESMDRQALHCKQLSFYHPIVEKTVQFPADLPEDMKELIE